MPNPFDQFDSVNLGEGIRPATGPGVATVSPGTQAARDREAARLRATYDSNPAYEPQVAGVADVEGQAGRIAGQTPLSTKLGGGGNPFDRFGPATPAPAAKAGPPGPPMPPEDPTSFKNLLGAAFEPLMTLGSGVGAQVLGGISGLGATTLGALGMDRFNGSDQARRLTEALTYAPKTTGGKNAMTVIGAIPEALSHGAEWLGDKTLDVTGSPGLATQVETAGKFIPGMLGAKGVKATAEIPGLVGKMKPEVAPAARALLDRDIRLTPGQILGGGWDKAEQWLSKVPIVGSFAQAARGRALGDFQRATLEDALAPINGTLPEGLVGREAVEHAKNQLGAAYEDVLGRSVGRLGPKPPPEVPPGMTPPPAGPSLKGDLDNLIGLVRQSKLPPALVDEFERTVQREVLDRFPEVQQQPQPRRVAAILAGDRPAAGTLEQQQRTLGQREAAIDAEIQRLTPDGRPMPAGDAQLISGESIKKMQTNLRDLAETKSRSENADVRQQGLALREAKAAIDRMLERENPDYAADLKAVDSAYGKFKVVQEAAAAVGAPHGQFSPAQFLRAVKNQDTSKDKARFAEGNARSQGFAEAGKERLSNTMPDSGTPYQMAMYHMLTGGAGSFFGWPALGAGAVPLAYSRPGVALAQRMLAGEPSTSASLAAGVPFGMMNEPQDARPPYLPRR